jgi:hypothetical protein
MKNFISLFLGLFIICSASGEAVAQRSRIAKTPLPKVYEPIAPKSSPALQTLLDTAINETIVKFAPKKLTADNVAATLIDLRDPKNLKLASYRGERQIYSASVVKLFYSAALHGWLEDGKLNDSALEVQRFENGLKVQT